MARFQRLGLALSATVLCAAFPGCHESDASPVEDVGPDATLPDGSGGDATDGSDDATDGGDATDAGDGNDVEQPKPPTLRCEVRLSSGPTAFGPPTSISLKDGDEPAEYKASPGFQLDLSAVTENVPNGTAVRLIVNGSRRDTITLSAATNGEGLATFTNFSVSGSQTLNIELTAGDEVLSCEATTFVLDTERCDVVLTPAPGCLGEDASADPGTQLAFTVENPDGRCDRAQVQYRIGGVEKTVESAALDADGKATFLVTVSPGAADGVELEVQGVVASTTSNLKRNETDWQAYTGDTKGPSITIESPLASSQVTAALDEDNDLSNGVQLPVTGFVEGIPDIGAQITVTDSVTGQSVDAVIAGASAPYTWKAVLTFTEPVINTTITATTTDACGNGGQAEVAGIEVNLGELQPGLTILTPTDGAVLLAVNDADASTESVYETTFAVQMVGGTAGASVSVECRDDVGGIWVPVGSGVVDATNTVLNIDVALDASASNALTCRAIDNSPAPTASPTVAITVGLPAPRVIVVLPSEGVATNDPLVALTAAAQHLDGAIGTVSVAGPGGVAFSVPTAAVVGDQLDTTVALTDTGDALGNPLPDGQYTLTLGLSDMYGNDACATAGADCSVTLLLDRSAPVLAFSAPDKTVLDPTVDLDSNAGSPGYQTNVVVSVSDLGLEGGNTVCLSLGGGALGCQVLPEGATTATFSDVTLQPGLNTLSASGTDRAGNAAVDATLEVTLDIDAPVVVISRPGADTSVLTNEVTIDVTLSTTAGAPITDNVVLSLSLDGGAFVDTAFSHTGGGVWLSPTIDLGAQGAHTVQVQAVVDAGTPGISALRTFTFKGGAVLEITEPAPGTINLATPDCSALAGACVWDEVVVTATNIDDGSAATLTVNCGSGVSTSNATASSGAIRFAGVSLANNSTCQLVVEVSDLGTGAIASASSVVSVDRTAPVLGPFTRPATAVIDRYTAGWTVVGSELVGDVTVTLAGLEAGSTVTLTTPAGDTAATVAAAVGDAETGSVTFPAQAFAEGFNTITVSASDAAGNPSTFQTTFRVDLVPGPATLTFDSPTPSTVFPGTSDGDASTTTIWEGTFTIGVSRGTVGSTLTLACRDTGDTGAPFVPVGTLVLAVGDGQVAMPVAIQVGSVKTKQCRLSDNAAKPAPTTTSTFTFLIPAPTLKITSPAEGTHVKSTAVILTAVTAFLDGRKGTFKVTGPGAGGSVSTTGVVAGVLFDTVYLTKTLLPAGTPLADGTYTISVAMQGPLGNDACASPSSDCSVTVVLDRTAPTAAFVEPSVTVLTPPGDPDGSTSTPGYQRDVIVSVSDATSAEGSSVCLTLGDSPVACTPVAAGETTVTFANVTLQPGLNTLTATPTDGAGNVGAAVTANVTVVSDAPQVKILVPAGSTSTAVDTVTITIEVRDNQGVLQDAGVAGTIYVDGAPSPATGNPLGNGQYSFDVTLPGFGPHTVTATASVNGGIEGASGTRTITYKENPPTIAVTSPPNGSTINLLSPLCGATPGNCVTTVTCTATDLDDGSAVTLTRSCGASVTTANAVASGGVASFPSVSLVNNATCTLYCEATDKGTGFTATSSLTTVTIDRTAPVTAAFVKPGSNSLIFVDDVSAAPGFQYIVQGRVGGVQAGQVVTLLAGTVNGEIVRQVTLSTSVPDGQLQIVTFAEMDLPQGLVTFTLTVSDAAGNPATPQIKTVQVVSEQPLVRISTPTYVAPNPCSVAADCPGVGECLETGDGKHCVLPWNSTSTTALLLRTQNIPTLTPNQFRVCSDNPAYAGNAACTASGGNYHVVQTFDVTLPDATVNIAANLVDGVHTLVGEAKLDDAGVNWASTTAPSVVSDQTRLVVVDRVAPTAAPVAVPTNVAPLGCLNAAEKTGSGYTVTTTCNEAGTARLLSGGVEVANVAATAGQTVQFTNVALGNGSVSLVATCADLVGNSTSTAAAALSVDTLVPTLSFTAPTVSPVLAGASRDVVLSSDEINGVVHVSDNGSEVAQGPVAAGGTATFTHTGFGILSDGSHQLTATVADACGNSRNATAVPLLVDTAVPTVAITSPANGAALADADDASAAPGYQVSLGWGTTGDAATAVVQLETNCASDFTGCNAPAQILSGNVTNPGGAEPAVLFTLPVFKAPDYVRLTVTVQDAAGNTASASRTFSVTLANCSVAVSGLPGSGKVGNALCAVAGQNCASVTATVVGTLVGACGGVDSMTLSVNGSVVDTQPVAGGTASFSTTLLDGSSPTLSLDGVGGAAPSSGALALTVDLQDPVPVFTATTVGGFSTPASGASVTWNAAADLSPTAGMQVNLRLDVTDVGVGGGAFTALTSNGTPVGGAPALPITITGTTFGVNLTGATLPDGAARVVVLTAQDGVGNTATTSFTYTADTVPPGPVALTLGAVNRRRPSATVSWNAVADDGSTGAPATAYEVRYGLAAISDANFDTACDAADLFKTAAVPTPGAPGAAETFTVTGPDSRNPSDACKFVPRSDTGAWFFAVRAVDDVGNPGPVTAGATVSSTELSLRYAKGGVARATSALCTGTAPQCDDDFDKRISVIGDVNNDGFDDFAVGGNTSFGFCIHYGQPTVAADFRIPGDLAVSAGSATNGAGKPLWQCVLDKVGGVLNEQKMGHYAQPAGDVNGDGFQDFAVPAYPGSPSKPEVRIFFGTNGGFVANTADVVIKGFHNAETGSTTRWGAGGDFNGDGFGDFVLAANKGNTSATTDDNRTFVVPGGGPAWTSGLVIDLSVPANLTTYKVQTFVMSNSVGGVSAAFGTQAGFVGNVLNDAGATQYDDIIVFAGSSAAPAETKAVVFKGRPTPPSR